MDVGELLSYKPNVQAVEQTLKRPNENDSDDEDRPDVALERAKKMRRLAQDKAESMSRVIKSTKEPQITEEERLKILQYVDQGGDETMDNIMDENGLKKMLLLFEKRNLRNQEMRIKFPDNPEKFMESKLSDPCIRLHLPLLINFFIQVKSTFTA